MEGIFDALHKHYVGVQIDGDTHRLFLEECRTIISNVRNRIIREKNPVGVTAGEVRLFEDEVLRAQKAAAELLKDEEGFFAELSAGRAELDRLEKTARATIEASGVHDGTLERLITEWEHTKNLEFLQEGVGNDEC